MIHAYDQQYLDKAQVSLAQMMRYAVQDLKYDPDVFLKCSFNQGWLIALVQEKHITRWECLAWKWHAKSSFLLLAEKRRQNLFFHWKKAMFIGQAGHWLFINGILRVHLRISSGF